MKVLITGGSGFIGSTLTDRLNRRGDHVVVIDNFATGRRDNLTGRDNLTLVEGDIADPALVKQWTGDFRPDLIVHAAASYKDPDDWIGDARTNALGSAIVARTAKEFAVKRIIYFQTALCYGLKPLQQPIALDHPILPGATSYAISKTAGEQYIALSGVDYVSFRLANAYGPRNLSGPLPTFFSRLKGGKECFVMDTRRDFIFIEDMVDCVMGAVDGRGRGVYHISSGADFAIKELYGAVIRAMRLNAAKDVEVRARHPDDAPTILLDPSRTQRDFGWRVKTPLADGVNQAIAYYEKFGIAETYTHLRPPR
jgi:UDP-glucose 4-epimerase